MSYSLTVPAGPKHDVADRLAASLDQARAASAGLDALPAMEDQFTGVIAAVPAIVAQVGRPEDHVEVHVSGHATPMHAPPDGYAGETCTVSVSVVRPS